MADSLDTPSSAVRVFPHREGRAHGNIVWAERNLGSSYYRVSKFAPKNGIFPADHPVAPKSEVFSKEPNGGQCGTSQTLEAFRSRGYWASCFPEGDGITWKPLKGQTDEQCLQDIREVFGWDVKWERT